MVPRAARPYLFAIAAVLFFGPICADAGAAPDKQIDIAVGIKGSEVTLDVDCFVLATPQEVWAVITDYGNATRFISNLEKSEIVSRSDDKLLVSQRGTMGLGPFSVTVEATNEIRLQPFEKLQSRMLKGSMRHHETTTRLSPEQGGTRISHHSESDPDIWIPPLIGRTLVMREARLRFSELLDEILRRKAAAHAGG
jgi:hypothetical protein